jgi:hypothetical protein
VGQVAAGRQVPRLPPVVCVPQHSHAHGGGPASRRRLLRARNMTLGGGVCSNTNTGLNREDTSEEESMHGCTIPRCNRTASSTQLPAQISGGYCTVKKHSPCWVPTARSVDRGRRGWGRLCTWKGEYPAVVHTMRRSGWGGRHNAVSSSVVCSSRATAGLKFCEEGQPVQPNKIAWGRSVCATCTPRAYMLHGSGASTMPTARLSCRHAVVELRLRPTQTFPCP